MEYSRCRTIQRNVYFPGTSVARGGPRRFHGSWEYIPNLMERSGGGDFQSMPNLGGRLKKRSVFRIVKWAILGIDVPSRDRGELSYPILLCFI